MDSTNYGEASCIQRFEGSCKKGFYRVLVRIVRSTQEELTPMEPGLSYEEGWMGAKVKGLG